MGSASLRDMLRASTQDAHTRLDASMQQVDIASCLGLGVFLQMQVAGWSGYLGNLPDGTKSKLLMKQAVEDAKEDLVCLNIPELDREDQRSAARPVDPVALDYVFLGGRLGIRMLARRWEQSADTRVKAACRFMLGPSASALWADFKRRTEADHWSHEDRARIVSDACIIFDNFLSVRQQQLNGRPLS